MLGEADLKTYVWGATALLSALGLLAGCGGKNDYVAPPPPAVTVSHPEQRKVTSYLEYTGATKAVESVDLRARVKGFLKERLFEEGSDVKAGQLLLVIDEEPFHVRVEQAKAKREQAESALTKAEQSKAREVARSQQALDQAALLLAQVEEGRQRMLLSRKASSKEDLDRAEANRKKADAQVESDKSSLEQAEADHQTNILAAKASLEQAKADVRNAEIDLGYCRVHAPIDGRISRGIVSVGNLVGDNQATLLATILKDNPVYVYMSVSESDLLRFRKMVSQGKRPDYRKHKIRLDMALSNESGFPHEGRVDYTDPGVDPGTGTIMARGIFPNDDHDIVPGLFVRVRVALEEHDKALLVPERSLSADQAGSFLLLVGGGNVVEQRPVKVGAAIDGMRVIEEGLKPDDLVIVNGLQRARPGQQVDPKQAKVESAAAVAAATSK